MPDVAVTDISALSCRTCEYDLRGLTEPRCPECGIEISLEELRDLQRRRHPFLFEHQPKRNVWSFFRTLVAGFWPVSFWTRLRSTPRVSKRWLLVYLIACCLPIATAFSIDVAVSFMQFRHLYRPFIASMRQTIAMSQAEAAEAAEIVKRLKEVPELTKNDADGKDILRATMNLAERTQHSIESERQRLGELEEVNKWQTLLRPSVMSQRPMSYNSWSEPHAVTLVATAAICLPLSIVVAIFGSQQRRRSRTVSAASILRTTAYSCDVLFITGVAAAGLATSNWIVILNANWDYSADLWSTQVNLNRAGSLLLAVSVLLVAYRLRIACDLYLKLQHPRLVATICMFVALLTFIAAIAVEIPK